jgi:hypothetical protein
MQEKNFLDYSSFLLQKFGEKVQKISVDAGFTCPNIDGKVGRGGCIYCNNKSFSFCAGSLLTVSQQIEAKIQTSSKVKKFLVYFQPYTNTYASVERLSEIYTQALQYDSVVGICIGTRPDEVDPTKIQLLQNLARKKFVSIEYGLQSIYNRTLEWIHRGHTYETFLHAMEITKNKGIHICAHVMLGFPTETKEQQLNMAYAINRACVDGIKIHNLLITKDTALEKMYALSPFPLLEYPEYLELVCDFLERLCPTIVIERLFATTPPHYLIGPNWKKSGTQIVDDIDRTLKKRGTCQGFFFHKMPF